MKKFSLIICLLVLVSCKTSKHSGCDAYGNNTIKSDPIKIKIEVISNHLFESWKESPLHSSQNIISETDKIIEIEKSIETDYFVGRLDVKIEYNGKIFICDFKSNQKNIYFENKLQLVAYSMAEQCDGLGIISVPDFTFIPVIINDKTPYQHILINLSNIFKLKKQIENETIN